MDTDGADLDVVTACGNVRAPDGSIDFSRYSLEQLRDLRYIVDRQAFPLHYQNLLDALRQNESAERIPMSPLLGFPGRFTTGAGLLAMTFTFKNGVYVNTVDEKVTRYGILRLPPS